MTLETQPHYHRESEPTVASFKPNTVFNDCYQIQCEIASGGMGAVYEVIHLATKRRYALKVLLPALVSEPKVCARFHQEMTLTAALESNYIVKVLDAGVDAATGIPFLVMELLKGQTIANVLRARGKLSMANVDELIRQVSLALKQTHENNIVHRDLKPQNLFLTMTENGPPRLKVLDFGIAKVVTQNSSLSGSGILGTPLYMSPEQITNSGSIGPAADLYAVGHLAYTLLVGEAYWKDEIDTRGILSLMAISRGPMESARARASRFGVELPIAFDAWFKKAVAVNPAERFSSAQELSDALHIALELPAVEHSSGGECGPDLSQLLESPFYKISKSETVSNQLDRIVAEAMSDLNLTLPISRTVVASSGRSKLSLHIGLTLLALVFLTTLVGVLSRSCV